MKLYTEEQIRETFIKGILKRRAGTLMPSDKLADLYLSLLTPIELPSDEEINNEANSFYSLISYNLVFKSGAKWMRDQIQGGNK